MLSMSTFNERKVEQVIEMVHAGRVQTKMVHTRMAQAEMVHAGMAQ